MNKIQSWNVITLFLILIFGFAGASLIIPPKSFSETENRSLAQRPEPRISDILSGKFEEQFESYLTDQFIGRDGWIRMRTALERLRGMQDVHDVYFASDDYLIEKHTGVFETERAERNAQALENFARKVSEKYDSEHFSVIIAPNAVDILRDKLPAFASPYDEEAYLKRIEQSLPEGVWVSASAVLREHKDEYIYYKTDHHWTTGGAFLVFLEYASRKHLGSFTEADYNETTLSDDFRGTVASKVGNTKIFDTMTYCEPVQAGRLAVAFPTSGTVRAGILREEMLEKKDKYAAFFGGNYDLVSITHDDREMNTGRRILVIKDSYAHCFVPMMTSLFDRIDMLDLRYYSGSLSKLIDEGDYTDILVLFNAAGFAEDSGAARLAG